jgi:hypothetical protein
MRQRTSLRPMPIGQAGMPSNAHAHMVTLTVTGGGSNALCCCPVSYPLNLATWHNQRSPRPLPNMPQPVAQVSTAGGSPHILRRFQEEHWTGTGHGPRRPATARRVWVAAVARFGPDDRTSPAPGCCRWRCRYSPTEAVRRRLNPRFTHAATVAPSTTVRLRGTVRMIRTLATLTRFLGAKLGANSARYEATLRHAQPESLQVNGTLGHVQRRRAIG